LGKRADKIFVLDGKKEESRKPANVLAIAESERLHDFPVADMIQYQAGAPLHRRNIYPTNGKNKTRKEREKTQQGGGGEDIVCPAWGEGGLHIVRLGRTGR